MAEAWRSGYKLPNRKSLTGKILDDMVEKEDNEVRKTLKDVPVTLIQDSWLDIHYKSVIATCLSDAKNVYFYR